jgi:hypothetical protein
MLSGVIFESAWADCVEPGIDTPVGRVPDSLPPQRVGGGGICLVSSGSDATARTDACLLLCEQKAAEQVSHDDEAIEAAHVIIVHF